MLIRTPTEIKLLDWILEELLEWYPERPDFHIIKKNAISKLKGKYYDHDDLRTEIALDEVVQNALKYLEEEKYLKYIIYEGNDNTIVIHYKGIVKIAKGGFVGEYKSNKRDKILQRIFWIAAALSLGLSLYVVLTK